MGRSARGVRVIPFVGPSYSLEAYKASAQRTVNMYLVGMETPNKAPFILRSVPGLTLFVDLGAAIRGAIRVGDRCFVVAGNTLYEVSSAGAATNRGTLNTSSGPVGMAYGLTQLVIVDGLNGYVLTLSSNVFAEITSDAFYGSATVTYLDGFFVFVRPDTQQFYITAIDDASDLDALDFASAEGTPDDLVACIADHRELWLPGAITTEVWYNSGGSFTFARNNGAAMEVGCLAPHSLRKFDNGLIWVGRDANGDGMVYRAMSVQQAARISTRAVEEALRGSTDLSEAVAWVYQRNGLTFYCLNAPGLTSTWCYEASTGTWFEWCDLDDDGEFEAFRVKHCVWAHGKHLVGGDNGKLYYLDETVNTFAGDTKVCERTSPHSATPTLTRVPFSAFVLDATTGEAPQGVSPIVELSWSNDGGATWGDPVQRSLGAVGDRFSRITWRRVGTARNRVWRVRFSDNAPFDIISAEVE
jgi:Phage stabilisation protein